MSRGIRLQNDMIKLNQRVPNQEESNLQRLWEDFKKDIKPMAQKALKNNKYKMESKIKALQKDRKNLNTNPLAQENNTIRTDKALLACEQKHLERKLA